MSEMAPNAPETGGSPAPSCCGWRSLLQTPLLLIVAAGAGFAGQQAWNNRNDLSALLSGSPAAGSGCSAAAMATPCSAMVSAEIPTGGCCSASQSASAESGCCAQATLAACCSQAAEAEAVAEESLSALAPANLGDAL
jgi:hypothetical protein